MGVLVELEVGELQPAGAAVAVAGPPQDGPRGDWGKAPRPPGEGETGGPPRQPRRSLFISQGRFIRPVLQDLPMSEWSLIQRGKSACTDSSAPDLTITENFAAKLALAPSSTRGYRDLVLTGAASRDDGHLDERPPFSAVLKWDGRIYSIDAQQQAWTAWRQ